MERQLSFALKCAVALPAVWVVLLLLSLPFPGGHPSLTGAVLALPASVSLAGRAVNGLSGDPGASAGGLVVFVVATLVELAVVGAAVGGVVRSLSRGQLRRAAPWAGVLVLYAVCHTFVGGVATSKVTTRLALAGPGVLRQGVLARISRDRDRNDRGVLLDALEQGREPAVDEGIIGALTWLEDGAFWHGYLTSPRASRWGTNLWAKVICDIATKSGDLRRMPGVDFSRLTESFTDLNRRMFDRLVTEAPSRPELLNPAVRIAFNNPRLGHTLVDRILALLQRPEVAPCVRLGFSYRQEWSNPGHPKRRLYDLARATCQDWTREDLELWLAHYESGEDAGPTPLNAFGLCQYIVDTEGPRRTGTGR